MQAAIEIHSAAKLHIAHLRPPGGTGARSLLINALIPNLARKQMR